MTNKTNSIKDLIDNNRRSFTGAAVIGLFIFGVFLMTSSTSVLENKGEIDTSEAEVADYRELNIGLPASLPLKLSIPSAKIEAEFTEPVGLEVTGEVAVPKEYDSVSYYKFGPTPGEIGPAVILGHVDSNDGPAVFFGLGQLEVGDEILVDREDGTTAKFEVTELERNKQNDFPTEKVYGDIDHAGLRLITCTGIYDRSVLRYTHNLIVYAKLITEE